MKKTVQDETSSAPVRHRRAIIFQLGVLALVIAFAVLTYLVSTIPIFSLDLQITRGLQSLNYPFVSWLMHAVSWVGFGPQCYIITIMIIILLFVFGVYWEATVSIFSAVFVSLLNLAAKAVVHRPRPSADIVHVVNILNGYSFPSGHVMYYTGFFGFIWFLAFTLLKPSWKRASLLVIFGGLVLLVGVSRIYLGQHWASDVVGAYLLGTLSLIGIIQLYRWGKTRYFVHQPVAEEAS